MLNILGKSNNPNNHCIYERLVILMSPFATRSLAAPVLRHDKVHTCTWPRWHGQYASEMNRYLGNAVKQGKLTSIITSDMFLSVISTDTSHFKNRIIPCFADANPFYTYRGTISRVTLPPREDYVGTSRERGSMCDGCETSRERGWLAWLWSWSDIAPNGFAPIDRTGDSSWLR